MLDHTADGALGVVLNRPGDDPCPPPLSDWSPVLSHPADIFVGGPVEPNAVIGLAQATGGLDGAWNPIGDGVVRDLGTVDLSRSPDEVASSFADVRLFRGYSGWGPLQLESELALGGWIVLPAEAGDIFTPDPAGLWRRVLRRQGGRLSWVADAPDDLSAN